MGGDFNVVRFPFERLGSNSFTATIQEFSNFILANKLKLLKNDLKRWNVDVFGHVEDRIKKLWKDVSVLENMEDS